MSYVDVASAYSDLVSVWRGGDGFRVILDDCRDPAFIAILLKDVGGILAGKSLVYSTRVAFDLPGQVTVTVPPMTAEQIRDLVTADKGQTMDDTELQKLLDHSQGNPLYIRFYAIDKSAGLRRDKRPKICAVGPPRRSTARVRPSIGQCFLNELQDMPDGRELNQVFI